MRTTSLPLVTMFNRRAVSTLGSAIRRRSLESAPFPEASRRRRESAESKARYGEGSKRYGKEMVTGRKRRGMREETRMGLSLPPSLPPSLSLSPSLSRSLSLYLSIHLSLSLSLSLSSPPSPGSPSLLRSVYIYIIYSVCVDSVSPSLPRSLSLSVRLSLELPFIPSHIFFLTSIRFLSCS